MRRMPRVAAAAIAVALLAPLPAAALTPSPGPSGPAGSSPIATTPSATPSAAATALPVTVVLRQLTPLAPQPGDVLALSGTLRNGSTAPVSDLGLQLRYNPTKIGSRSVFDDYAIGSRTPTGQFGPLPLPPV